MAEVPRWADAIEQVHECIAGRSRLLAEQAGHASPDGPQRLLYKYRWDADQVRDGLRDYMVEHLGDADGVVVVERDGVSQEGRQVRQAVASVQWDRGRIRNSQVGVFLTHTGAKVMALLNGEFICPRYRPKTGSGDGKPGFRKKQYFGPGCNWRN